MIVCQHVAVVVVVHLWSRSTHEVLEAEEEQRFNASVDLQEACGLGEIFRQKAGQLAACEVCMSSRASRLKFGGVIRRRSLGPCIDCHDSRLDGSEV